MDVSPQDAAQALRDVEDTQARSATLRGYQQAAPHFLIWGMIWIVGYGLSDVFHEHAKAIWGVLVPIGLVAGLFAKRGANRTISWHYTATALSILCFLAATLFVMWPVSGRQISAFIPLMIALLYALGGIWSGPRYIIAGIAVAVLTLIGFVWV